MIDRFDLQLNFETNGSNKEQFSKAYIETFIENDK